MTKYREIVRLHCQGYSKRNIANSVPCSRNTAARVADRADELKLKWPLPSYMTDAELEKILFPRDNQGSSNKVMPDVIYIRAELQKNGVTKKLLWTEYLETCRQMGKEPLMYSQFCYYILEDEKKRNATILDEWLLMKPTEQEQKDIFELLHRRRKKSSTIFCSQYRPEGWYEQLGGDASPLADAILDRIVHDSYRINIESADPTRDISMREVYGMDKSLCE